MELTVVNISGKVRTAKFDGRDFLVVPMTMMVPGVLNGSRGPLLYPEDEAAKSATAWNWIPIVVNHPMTGSARTPDYMSTNGVGHLTNCEFKDGKLKAEGWFDITKTDKVDNRLIPLMRAGKKVELSTGLGVDLETAEGVHNDRTYVAVARSYRPDHLAILPDDVGACSLQDGCGINNSRVDNGIEYKVNGKWMSGSWKTIRGAKVFIDDSGTVVSGPKSLRGKKAGETDEDKSAKSKGSKKHLGTAGLRGKKGTVDSLLKELNDRGFDVEPDDEHDDTGHIIKGDEIVGQIVGKKNAVIYLNSAKSDQLLASNAKSGGVWRTIRGAKVYIEDGKITKGPKSLRGKSESEAKGTTEKSGGKKEWKDLGPGDEERAKELADEASAKAFKAETIEESAKAHKTAASRTRSLAGSPNLSKEEKAKYENKSKNHQALADKYEASIKSKSSTGSSKPKPSGAKSVRFSKQSDGSVTTKDGRFTIKKDSRSGYVLYDKEFDKTIPGRSMAVLKATAKGRSKHTKEDTKNQSFPLNHMEIPMCKQSLIDQLVENSDGLWSELDREHLDAFPEERLEQLVDNMCGDASHDDTDEEDEPAKGKAKMTNNKEVTVVPQPRQPITLDDLPAEFRAVYNHGLQAMNREKDNLIDKLVANISDEDAKKAKIETLSKKTMCELKEIASLLPVSNSQQEDHFWKEPEYNYQGAAVGNVRNEAYKPEPLGLPEMDFTA